MRISSKKISNTTPRIANTARKTIRPGTNEILEPRPTTFMDNLVGLYVYENNAEGDRISGKIWEWK
jgi:hypothetical protein